VPWVRARAGASYCDAMQWYLLIAGTGLATGGGVLILRRRRRRPLTIEEKAAAARVAMQAIRRSAPRANRDIFHRGRGVPDRHSAAIAENTAYGDAANFDTGGDGGGGGSD
jgi:LPXTG-motif cell wall-anchored protein